MWVDAGKFFMLLALNVPPAKVPQMRVLTQVDKLFVLHTSVARGTDQKIFVA